VIRDRLFRLLPFLLGSLAIAGIVHLVIILLVPAVAGSTAAARLSAGAPANRLELLAGGPPGSSELPFPFADPAMVTAVCRFDLSEGPVRLRVPTADGFLSVVVLRPDGRVQHALTDRAATRRQLAIVLATPQQLRQLESLDPDDQPVQDLRLRASHPGGVAVIRSLAQRDAERPAIQALLGRASCQQD
jgi:uncharacterized membrane protein